MKTYTETKEVLVNSIHFGSYHSRPLNSWNEETPGKIDRFKLEENV